MNFDTRSCASMLTRMKPCRIDACYFQNHLNGRWKGLLSNLVRVHLVISNNLIQNVVCFFCLLFFTRCGGTVGAILTCPLEVVKTRLQSSSISLYVSEVQLSTVNGASVARMSPPGPLHCLKWVLNNMSSGCCIYVWVNPSGVDELSQ